MPVATPSHVERSLEGHVRAWDAALAHRAAELLDELAPRVRAALGVVGARRPVVWLASEPRVDGDALGTVAATAGTEERRCILLGADAAPLLREVLTHELVHWYTEEEPWCALPHALEEGLADYVVLSLRGELDSYLATHPSGGGIDDVFGWSSDAWREKPLAVREMFRPELVRWIFEHGGVEGLRSMESLK